MLFTFYDFPAEHWIHLRTTNPIESTFATVRHHSSRRKVCGSRLATLTVVFQLVGAAKSHWRRLNKPELVLHVVEVKIYVDGILQEAA